jgi:hypothetical protein
MDPGTPQGLISIDIADSPQDSLIEKERFHTRPPASQPLAELSFSRIQGIQPQPAHKALQFRLTHQAQPTEAADIGVAELSAILESEETKGMRRDGFLRPAGHELAGHT